MWLIFLKDFTQCLNNTGLASIIMEGKALTGTPYLTLDDMKRKNSQEQIFIDFFNAQMSDRESTSRAVIVSTCYEHSPWLFNYYATPKTLIIQNYVLSGHPTIKVVIPTEEEISQSASDLGFSSSWVSECLDWRLNRQIPAIVDDLPFAHNPSPIEQSQIVDRIQSFYMRSKYINAAKLKQYISLEETCIQIDTVDAAYQITLDEAIPRIIERHFLHEHEYESYVNKRMTDAAKSMERMRSVQESCHKAFSYVGDISTIANAKKFLSENRFFDAFRAINDHFMKIGVSDIRRFETEARAHTLQFGQDLNHHIESVKASIQRWILMELLERERLTPRINLVASSSSSSSSSALSPAPVVQCSTKRMLSLLDKDEICDANSFDQEDYRLTACGIPIILTEHKRYDIYLNSISASPSSRFRSVADHFSRSPESEQTVVRLLGMLQDAERSQIGVANLANERLKHSNWYTDLHSYLGALQTDTNPSGSSAHVAQAHVAFAGDTPTHKICRNPRHKNTTSHVSSDCTDKIWGPLWKAFKIDPKTGLPKDGSALPPQPQRDQVPAVVSPPPAARPAARDPTVNPKTRYSGPPCTFCTSRPELKHIAYCHSDADCRKKPKYSAQQQKKASSKTRTAQVAQATGSSDGIHAQVAQLTGTVGKLVAALSKKRKHEDPESGEEDA